MPNLLYDAQQTRYGQLVTNSRCSNNNYISSDFTKKLWCETYLKSELLLLYQRVLPFSTTTRVTRKYDECDARQKKK